MFEMLTGHPPFLADSPLAVAFKQVHENPPLLSKVRPDVLPRLELIVAKCLKKNQTERYANADELLRDLDTVYLELQTPQQITDSGQLTNKRITDRRFGDRRFFQDTFANPRPILLAAFLFILVAAGIMAWQLFSSPSHAENAGWIHPVSMQASEKNLWDADQTTIWAPRSSEEKLNLDLGKPYALQSVYIDAGTGIGESDANQLVKVEILLDNQKTLRYSFEYSSEPQMLNLQGRISSRLKIKFITKGNGLSAIREVRILGLPYE